MKPRLSLSASMPLLVKELIEQAAKPRTYLVRVAYALLVFTLVGAVQYEMFTAASLSPADALGQGQAMFQTVLVAEFIGIYTFLPAMLSGVVTRERERDTLTLLLLTDLTPWQIIVQKLAGRLVPMFTFLLLAMPLLAVAYAYGGVSTSHFWAGVYLLFVTAVQVGSIAVMLSAYCRTTSSATSAVYLLGPILYFASMLGTTLTGVFALAIVKLFAAAVAGDDVLNVSSDAMFGLFPPIVMGGSPDASTHLGWLVAYSLPTLCSCLLWLKLGADFLTTRTGSPAKYLVRLSHAPGGGEQVGWIDAETGAITRIHKRGDLPGDEPIAWRELSTRTFGNLSNQFGLIVYLEVIVFLFEVMFAATGERGASPGLSVILGLKWVVMAALVSMTGVNMFTSDRLRQTMDVLLSTPLTGRQIIYEKTAVPRRWLAVSWVLFAPVFVLQWCLLVRAGTPVGQLWLYAICSVLSVVVYLPLLVWLSTWIGLKVEAERRVTLLMLGVLVVWVVGPVVLGTAIERSFDWRPGRWGEHVYLLSPAWIVLLNETQRLNVVLFGWASVAANFALYGGLLWWFRRQCLHHADAMLGRSHGSAEDDME